MTSPLYRDPNAPPNRSGLYALLQPLAMVAFVGLAALGALAAFHFFSNNTDLPVEAYSVVAPEEVAEAQITLDSIGAQESWVASNGDPLRVGLISGHAGSDAGAVCDNGLTEADVNRDIVTQVAEQLEGRNIEVIVLDEFDARLDGFLADTLVSVHADSCRDYGDTLTGFKLAEANTNASLDLKNCMYQAYALTTQLYYHVNTITEHMTDYHAFRKIAPGTPAIIIEAGFMNRDMELLTTQSHVPAQGIEAGILCYLEQAR